MNIHTGKVVLVTGASSGIGAAIAELFSMQGARVAMTARNETKLKNVSAKCEQKGNKPLVIIGDVSKDNDVQNIVNNTIDHFGKIDILINNAGMIGLPTGILSKESIDLYDKVIATNLRGPIYMTNLAAPYILKTKGNIINISSICSTKAVSINYPYCTSKAGLDHFTRCIAFELGPYGVRANCIIPGPVRTDCVVNMGPRMMAIRETAFERMKKSTVLNRTSEPEEIADLVLFLASDKAKGITGASFVSDNGALLKGSR